MMKEKIESIKGYRISTNKKMMNAKIIHQYLSEESYWAKNIPLVLVRKIIINSFCIGLFDAHKQQIGFARVVTDYCTFAYLADVFVLEAHRGKGLSKWMMKTLHAQPKLQGLRRWMLATRDAHGLYKQLGWQPVDDPSRLMQIVFPNLYQQTSAETA
jgi:GNAT superfamily N-acetyltransferase